MPKASYWAPLKKQWEENRKRIKKAPLFPGSEYGQKYLGKSPSKSLRGSDFVNKLLDLYWSTGDERFRGALAALSAHKIIDEKSWRFIRSTAVELGFMREIEMVANKHRDGLSLRMACAVIAAETGFPAPSFETAVHHLASLYRRVGKKTRR